MPSPSEARARQQPPKILILKIGGTFWLKSEPFLTKIRTANFDAPPRRRSLTLATPQKSFLHIFYFARARFFCGRAIVKIYSRLCPAPPVRGRHKGTPLMIFLYFFRFISYHYSRKNTHFIK